MLLQGRSPQVILELRQTIWFTTPKGRGRAILVIDRGDESDLQWVCFLDTGEVWTFSNWDLRLLDNVTMGRKCEWMSNS